MILSTIWQNKPMIAGALSVSPGRSRDRDLYRYDGGGGDNNNEMEATRQVARRPGRCTYR